MYFRAKVIEILNVKSRIKLDNTKNDAIIRLIVKALSAHDFQFFKIIFQYCCRAYSNIALIKMIYSLIMLFYLKSFFCVFVLFQ